MTVEIKLTKGYTTIVDDEDADLAQKYSWYWDKGYAVRRGSVKEERYFKNTRLHRVILERKLGRHLKKEELCDHINGIPLDNRRENLRATDSTGNARNRRPKIKGRQGTYPQDGKWIARIQKDDKQIYLGMYDTPEEAHAAYRGAAKVLYGEFTPIV